MKKMSLSEVKGRWGIDGESVIGGCDEVVFSNDALWLSFKALGHSGDYFDVDTKASQMGWVFHRTSQAHLK